MINIIDTKVYNLVFELFSMPMTFIMTFISYIGSASFLILLCIVFLIVLKDKKISMIIIMNLAIVYLLNILIKVIVARPRPEGLRLIYETGYSFPSGHAMVATGFYGFLIYLANKKIKNKNMKNVITVLLSLLIFLIGISRIYLGAHFASDILGAFLIGYIYLILFINLIKGEKTWKKYLQ